MQPTILVAVAHAGRRDYLAAQLDADGHPVHTAADAAATTAKLGAHAIDVLILGALEQPADTTTLLRRLRAGKLHTHVHPAQPIITVGEADDVATLRAYEAGSDHHLPTDTGYLVLRAVIAALARRTLHEVTSRHIHVGELHIDTAARTADIGGTPVKLTRTGYVLLTTLAGDPQRLFTKDELKRVLWGDVLPSRSRALDSHVCHLRRHLAAAGADLITNTWGQGYKLAPGEGR